MTFVVKNKRLKMSPGGIISLPVSARKALGMQVNQGTQLNVVVGTDHVLISGEPNRPENSLRVSKKGLLELPADAKAILSKRNKYYWLELDDKNKSAKLRPF